METRPELLRRCLPSRSWLALPLLLVACRITPEIRESPPLPPRIPVEVASSDPVLREVLCERLRCRASALPASVVGEGPAGEAMQTLGVEISLHDSSADLLRNNLTSLATLTIAAFVTHSVDVDYSIRSGGVERSGTMRIRHGMWAVLPVYMGLAATNLGSALNTYRDPVDLQRYCLLDEPRSARKWIHGDRRRMCSEYHDFLESVAIQLEPQLHAVLFSHTIPRPASRNKP